MILHIEAGEVLIVTRSGQRLLSPSRTCLRDDDFELLKQTMTELKDQRRARGEYPSEDEPSQWELIAGSLRATIPTFACACN